MKIVGLDELTPNQLADELKHGGKFVMYKFCISLLIVTFQRPSSIYFIRSDQSRVPAGLVGLCCPCFWVGGASRGDRFIPSERFGPIAPVARMSPMKSSPPCWKPQRSTINQ